MKRAIIWAQLALIISNVVTASAKGWKWYDVVCSALLLISAGLNIHELHRSEG